MTATRRTAMIRLLSLAVLAHGDVAFAQPAPASNATPPAAGARLNIIAFGAHPDDCDIRAGGTAARWAAAGHRVRFVSVTNGDAGHHEQGGGALAARRRAEAREAGRRIGVDYVVLDNHDGELLPSLAIREQIIRQIREWKADLVLGPRPSDYHPDHRYTGILLQDAAFMVTVPNVASDTPSLRRNPVFMYFQDDFQKPAPFSPDVAVSTDESFQKKIDMLDAHVSQVYEWLPWHAGRLDAVPTDPAARRAWLATQRAGKIGEPVRAALVKRYGAGRGEAVQHAEAFELCEYRPPAGERRVVADVPVLIPGFARVEGESSRRSRFPVIGSRNVPDNRTPTTDDDFSAEVSSESSSSPTRMLTASGEARTREDGSTRATTDSLPGSDNSRQLTTED